MILNLYSVFDTKAKTYSQPIFQENDDVSIRSAIDTMNAGNSLIADHPEDFQIFCVGTFDQDTGKITGSNPRHVLNFHEIQMHLELIEKGESVNSPEPIEADLSKSITNGEKAFSKIFGKN